jgi:hypothetical protein
LGKGQKLSQRTHNDDITLSTLLAGDDLNVVDERPDDVDCCSSSLVVQNIFQLSATTFEGHIACFNDLADMPPVHTDE